MKRYTVKLTKAEVEELMSIINKGSHTSQTFRAAYILLNCDEGPYSQKVTNEQISKVLKVGMRTIDRVKKKLVEEGFDAVLERRATKRNYDVLSYDRWTDFTTKSDTNYGKTTESILKVQY